MDLDPELFLRRIVEYTRLTKIQFRNVQRLSQWQKFGLPDTRGFTPHLRVVNTAGDQHGLKNFMRKPRLDSCKEFLWTIHDILHIVFYDYMSFNLGEKVWNEPERFIEGHLASEAFAVLLLDYHVLPYTTLGGLAVDFQAKEWPRFQGLNSLLADFGSHQFCHDLTSLYLTNNRKVLNPARLRPDKKYQNWIGHEERYSRKQRFYVLAWLEDLYGRKNSRKEALLEETFVSEALWDLIHIFTKSNDDEWARFLKGSAKFLKPRMNRFKDFPKYKKRQRNAQELDYRFTDIFSQSKKSVSDVLNAAGSPQASHLFLFWQILSTFPPTLIKASHREAIRQLALSSQTMAVDKESWLVVRSLCQHLLPKIKWKRDASVLSTFFLP